MMKLLAITAMIANLLLPSNVDAVTLEQALNSNLKQYAEVFVQAEEETGVNAIFLASVAALESGWGTSNIAETHNNLYGFGDGRSYISFESVDECIFHVANFLKDRYLTEDGEFYNGTSVEAVNERYNGRKEWEDVVTEIMTSIHSKIDKKGGDSTSKEQEVFGNELFSQYSRRCDISLDCDD